MTRARKITAKGIQIPLLLHPPVLQRHSAVKHGRSELGFDGVGVEVSDAFELPVAAGGGILERGFEFGSGDDF